MSGKLAKKHIKRLTEMLNRMDKVEAAYQRIYGDKKKGSSRLSECRDMDSLHAVVTYLEAQA